MYQGETEGGKKKVVRPSQRHSRGISSQQRGKNFLSTKNSIYATRGKNSDKKGLVMLEVEQKNSSTTRCTTEGGVVPGKDAYSSFWTKDWKGGRLEKEKTWLQNYLNGKRLTLLLEGKGGYQPYVGVGLQCGRKRPSERERFYAHREEAY